MPDETLLAVIKRELRERNYVEIDPNPNGGGVWSHPDWEEATGSLFEALQDAFEEGR